MSGTTLQGVAEDAAAPDRSGFLRAAGALVVVGLLAAAVRAGGLG